MLNQEEFEGAKLSLRKYAVADLIMSPSQLKVLFVLESPHKDEFIHSHPVAGSTGKNLSNLFKSLGYLSQFSPTEPIGCQIKKYNYPHLGIIEASSLPMDTKFYPCFLSSADKKLIQSLSKTKKRLEKGPKKNLPTGIVEQYLVNDFTTRLNLISTQTTCVFIISFGHIAANFLNAANVAADLKLPHPTGKMWPNAAGTLSNSKLNQLLLP